MIPPTAVSTCLSEAVAILRRLHSAMLRTKGFTQPRSPRNKRTSENLQGEVRKRYFSAAMVYEQLSFCFRQTLVRWKASSEFERARSVTLKHRSQYSAEPQLSLLCAFGFAQ